MNVKLSDRASDRASASVPGPVVSLASPPDEQLAGVLLTELVRTLTTELRPGTVLGGRPHLRLFGEAIDLALPLRALRRLGEAAPAPTLELDDDTLRRHGRAIVDPEGYLISPADLYAAHPLGTRTDAHVPADAMSLRLHTSVFARPMNALLRADPAAPESWLGVVEALRQASQRAIDHDERAPTSGSFARRAARLHASLAGLDRLDDPRLPRLLGEQLVHAFMAVHALLRQRRVRGMDAPPKLRVTCTLPDAVLAALREANAAPGGAWRDPGLLSAWLHARPQSPLDSNHAGPLDQADMLEIRPRLHGSAGRWLDGTTDGVGGPVPQVSFPPGTPFEVLELRQAPARTNAPTGARGRIVAQLAELPPRRAVSAWTPR